MNTKVISLEASVHQDNTVASKRGYEAQFASLEPRSTLSPFTLSSILEGQVKTDRGSDCQMLIRSRKIGRHPKYVHDQLQPVLTAYIISEDKTAEPESTTAATQGNPVECKSSGTSVTFAEIAA